MGFKLKVLSVAAVLFVFPLGASAASTTGAGAAATKEGVHEPLYYFCMAGLGASNRFYVTPVMRETWHYDPLGLVLKQPVNYSWKQAVKEMPLANIPHCEGGTKANAERARQLEIEQVTRFKHKVVDVEWHYGQTGPATLAPSATPATDSKTTTATKNSGDAKPPQPVAPAPNDKNPTLRH